MRVWISNKNSMNVVHFQWLGPMSQIFMCANTSMFLPRIEFIGGRFFSSHSQFELCCTCVLTVVLLHAYHLVLLMQMWYFNMLRTANDSYPPEHRKCVVIMVITLKSKYILFAECFPINFIELKIETESNVTICHIHSLDQSDVFNFLLQFDAWPHKNDMYETRWHPDTALMSRFLISHTTIFPKDCASCCARVKHLFWWLFFLLSHPTFQSVSANVEPIDKWYMSYDGNVFVTIQNSAR